MILNTIFLFFSGFSSILAHCVLQTPGNRHNLNWHSWHPSDGYGITCPPGGNKNILATYSRNQLASVSWARNNHQGGFVRFSIVKQEFSGISGAFEKKKSIIQYNCWETDCSGASEWGDDGGKPAFTNMCHSKLKIPTYLSDGTYTLQWMWFSGWGAFTDKNPIQTFISCADVKISGGPLTTYSGKTCVPFRGGDVHTNTNCAYFVSKKPKQCWCPDKECQSQEIECYPNLNRNINGDSISTIAKYGKPIHAC